MVMPSLLGPVSSMRRSAPRRSARLTHYTIMLPAGRSYSTAACLALTEGETRMRVLRRERGARIVRDSVLEGSEASRPKWLGHWLVRLAALHGGIGLTTALILDGPVSTEHVRHVATLASDGAWVHRSGALPQRDKPLSSTLTS